MPTEMSKGARPRNFFFSKRKQETSYGSRKIMGTVERLKVYALLMRNHSSNHLTLNPSPGGEGLSSIAERDGCLRTIIPV
jgi:hypothetical protein